jgi:hypothetical protein
MTGASNQAEVTSYGTCSQQLLCCSGRGWYSDNGRAAALKRLTAQLHTNAARLKIACEAVLLSAHINTFMRARPTKPLPCAGV